MSHNNSHNSHKKTAIIIGAGAGGLALANMLAKAGMSVSVYEKNAAPGGRMGQLKKQGFTFDTGPSWYLMKDVFSHYFGLFDKQPSDYYQLTKLNPSYKVFFESDQPLTVVPQASKNFAQFESREPGAAKNLSRYLSQGKQNYHLALKYFLYNPFIKFTSLLKPEVIKHTPALFSLFGSTLHSYVAKHFKNQQLQQVLEYPSVFLGVSPFTAPALYQLMSYLDFSEGVFYPKKKGMHAITEALCDLGKELGVTYHYGSAVSKILVNNKVAVGAVINKKSVFADIVISNADLHFTETKLLDAPSRSYPEQYWRKRTPGPSALLLYLGVTGSLPELEHHNLFFVSAWKANFAAIYTKKEWPEKASMYVSKTTQTDASTAPKGHENLFVLVPLPAGLSKTKQEADQYIKHYLKELEKISKIRDLRRRIVLQEVRTPDDFGSLFNSWQNTALGMGHTLRQSAFLRPSVKSKKVKNLYYVGAGTQPGIGVPMCIISAQLVYKHIIKDWSAGPLQRIQRIKL